MIKSIISSSVLYIVLNQITTKALSQRTQFIFDTPCSYFPVRELDIVLRNHALRAQPTDYSLMCRYTNSLICRYTNSLICRYTNSLICRYTNSLVCRLRCFPELTVGFQPMRKQMVSTMYNNEKKSYTFLTALSLIPFQNII